MGGEGKEGERGRRRELKRGEGEIWKEETKGGREGRVEGEDATPAIITRPDRPQLIRQTLESRVPKLIRPLQVFVGAARDILRVAAAASTP